MFSLLFPFHQLVLGTTGCRKRTRINMKPRWVMLTAAVNDVTVNNVAVLFFSSSVGREGTIARCFPVRRVPLSAFVPLWFSLNLSRAQSFFVLLRSRLLPTRITREPMMGKYTLTPVSPSHHLGGKTRPIEIMTTTHANSTSFRPQRGNSEPSARGLVCLCPETPDVVGIRTKNADEHVQ